MLFLFPEGFIFFSVTIIFAGSDMARNARSFFSDKSQK
jgi:hypothetical protein